jgi:hypothetical protein
MIDVSYEWRNDNFNNTVTKWRLQNTHSANWAFNWDSFIGWVSFVIAIDLG